MTNRAKKTDTELRHSAARWFMVAAVAAAIAGGALLVGAIARLVELATR